MDIPPADSGLNWSRELLRSQLTREAAACGGSTLLIVSPNPVHVAKIGLEMYNRLDIMLHQWHMDDERNLSSTKLCMHLVTVRAIGDNGGEKSDVIDELRPKVALEYGNSMHMFVQKQNDATIMDSSTSQTPETEDGPEATGDSKLLQQRIESDEDEFVKTMMFDVVISDSKLLCQEIKSAEAELNRKLNQLEYMKDKFNRDIRPRLVPLCLVLPDAMDSDLTAFLHGLTHNIIKRDPIYLSALDVMMQQENMHMEAFEYFVSYIIAERVMVAEVWDQSFGDIETSVYDLAADGPDFYRGESDASFNENLGVAKLSIMIWKDSQVVWAEVIERVNCCSINDAEVLAALALQLKCLKLGFVKKLKHFTDSAYAVNVINGKHTIELNDPQRNTYMLLRHLKEKFETLIPALRPRQLMFMPDALLRLDGVPTDSAVEQLLKQWCPHLRGAPVFRVYQNKTARNIINSFGDRAEAYKHKIDKVFYLTVEREKKFDALVQLMDTFSTDCVYLAIDKFNETEFLDKICIFLPHEIEPMTEGTYSIFRLKKIVRDDTSKQGVEQKTDVSIGNVEGTAVEKENGESDKLKRRKLLVAFDAALPRHNLCREDSCTIILTEPHELNLMKNDGIKEMSTATFVQFHGVEHKALNKKSKTPKRKNRKCRERDGGQKNAEHDKGGSMGPRGGEQNRSPGRHGGARVRGAQDHR